MTRSALVVMRRALAWACAATLGVTCATPSEARNGNWEPPGLHAAALDTAAIFLRLDAAEGVPDAAYAQRVERWTLRAGSRSFAATADVRDAAFRVTTVLDGATYLEGRNVDGTRWRRTPTGISRIIRADVQGDDLDRWPLTVLGFARDDCIAFATATLSAPADVLECRTAYDVPHWLFVDASSGRIVREMMRDGTRVVTWTFDDRRVVDGLERPFHWAVDGAGGHAEVTVDDVTPQPVALAEVAMPPTTRDVATPLPSGDATGVITLPTTFDRRYIMVDVAVNGSHEHFILDTGTTQLLLPTALAARDRISTAFGHGIATRIDVGGVHLRDAAIQTVDNLGIGILGYDFFVGRVVHVDYRHERVDVQPAVGFAPPADCTALPASFAEGMPLVAAQIGAATGTRFALDTGSSDLLLLRYFAEHDGAAPAAAGITFDRSDEQRLNFLEGPIVARPITIATFAFAGNHFGPIEALLEVPNRGATLEAPLDGIIGSGILHIYEWWIDANTNTLWYR